VGVREMMLGIVAVGLVVGVTIGRHAERVRRNVKDYGAAKAAVPKARQLSNGTIGKAVLATLAWGGLMVFIFFVVINLA
jgi:hypothetical protein